MDDPASPGHDGDDRTTIRPRTASHATRALLPAGHVLPLGTRLLDYEITGLIGEGGFGIVYLAWDHSLQRKVAVKEYMPASMAARAAGSSAIVVKSGRHLDTFRAGLKSFVNEARLLARFDHRALVKVYRFWEENGTAYMVMPFYEGPTLKSALAALGRAPDEEEIRRWLTPLLDALDVMHAAQCFHRDIAPDNILLTPAGPLLLDFGAARRVIGDMTHALTVVLKPGYAPIEQYGDVAAMAQGPWTDLYALACVVYYAITGHTPSSSVERLMDDRLAPLASLAAGRYAPAFLVAVDAALAVRPQDRPQDARRFRALLDVDRPAAREASDSAAAPLAADTAPGPFPRTRQELHTTVPDTLTPVIATQIEARPAIAATEPTVVAVAAGAAPEAQAGTVEPGAARPAARPPSAQARRERPRTALTIAGVVVAALVVVAVWWASTGSPFDPAAPQVVTPVPLAIEPSEPAMTPAIPASSAAPESAAASAIEPTAAIESAATAEPAAARLVEPARTDEPVTAPPVVVAPPRPMRPREPRLPAPTPRERTSPEDAQRPIGGRCSDILQKGSLQPLTAEESAYLRRECR